VHQQTIIPDTELENHRQASLHGAAAAHLEAHAILLPDDRWGEEKGIPFCRRWEAAAGVLDLVVVVLLPARRR
jgi:hypothetical protein